MNYTIDYTFLILFVVIALLLIGFSVMIFGYNFYYKNLYYKTTKYRLISMWPILAIAVVFFALTIASFVLQYSSKSIDFFVYNPYISYCSLVIYLVSTGLSIYMFVTKKSIVQQNHKIQDFWKEDFDSQLKKLTTSKNYNKYIKSIDSRPSKFINQMNDEYNLIIKLINNKEDLTKVLIKIVQFNEKYTPKFSKKTYVYHLNKFLNLCIKIRQTY